MFLFPCRLDQSTDGNRRRNKENIEKKRFVSVSKPSSILNGGVNEQKYEVSGQIFGRKCHKEQWPGQGVTKSGAVTAERCANTYRSRWLSASPALSSLMLMEHLGKDDADQDGCANRERENLRDAELHTDF